GQPISMVLPEVVGFRLHGALKEGATATDLVLTVTQMLRKKGVVNKFVEFTGPGVGQLGLADRATLSNMAPEYGATAGLFPVDLETLRYLRLTGRSEAQVELVERYTKEQRLFRSDGAPEPRFNDVVELDLASVEPSLAGPNRPEGRVALGGVRQNFRQAFAERLGPGGNKSVEVQVGRAQLPFGDGSVAIAAITSCTNTSNPSVLLGAGLIAKHAVERGLKVKPTVKTSLAPGSKVVDDYLERAGLTPYLEALGFHIVGHGCTTCIGNSGPLSEPISSAIQSHNLNVAAVLSGNRNFDGRIHPDVRAQYLASPPLVVAFALAGTVDIDLTQDPIGQDGSGKDVYLRDIWPSNAEIRAVMDEAVRRDLFEREYSQVLDGDEYWRSMPVPQGDLYQGDPASTYVQIPPYFDGLSTEPAAPRDIAGARALLMLGNSITTDHISPA
ncbi:MAG: aconitate hydratase, partial [Chloroflexota bacterium]|nr:aconitate hydratase [Chloroflexota bacterium]